MSNSPGIHQLRSRITLNWSKGLSNASYVAIVLFSRCYPRLGGDGDRTPGEASLSELEGLESIDCGYHLALCFVLLCLPFVPVSY